jgi:hypothetical protein
VGTDSYAGHAVRAECTPPDSGFSSLAHRGCNAAKADRLAAAPHLERWHGRNVEARYALPRRFDDQRLPHNRDVSLRITSWAYQLGGEHRREVWVKGKELVRLPANWETILNGGGPT